MTCFKAPLRTCARVRYATGGNKVAAVLLVYEGPLCRPGTCCCEMEGLREDESLEVKSGGLRRCRHDRSVDRIGRRRILLDTGYNNNVSIPRSLVSVQ